MSHLTKERPILFSGPMVTAILAGTKTMTRRVIKPQPTAKLDWVTEWGWTFFTPDKHISGRVKNPAIEPREIFLPCPYALGQHLWVRETMREGDDGVWVYAADSEPVGCDRADEGAMITWAHHKETSVCSSIHMPRWASRITLEIVNVKAERLHRIGELSAKAEGVTPKTVVSVDRLESYASYCAAFVQLWDSINAKTGYGWDTNPWVWAITFRQAVTP